MLLFSIESTGGYSPNSGHQPSLKNQVGQDEFKLDAYLTAKNTGEDYSGVWQVTQTLIDGAGKEFSKTVKDGVTAIIPKGGSVEFSPLGIGSLPMKGVDTAGKAYGHRQTVKDAAGVVLADQVTPLRFNETDTYFDGVTMPFKGFVPPGTNDTAKVELADKEKVLAVTVALIAKSQDEVKVLQPRIDKLKALLT